MYVVLLLVGVNGCRKSVDVDVTGVPVTEAGALPECEPTPPVPTRGGAMTPVGFAGGKCFWMDIHEVSRAEYESFLTQGPQPAPAPCQEGDPNDVLACEEAALGGSVRITREPDHPQVCVDWCDAAAYCAWTGKSLCRGDRRRAMDPSASSFFSGCSTGGTLTTPAPDEEPATCNSARHPVTGCRSGTCTTLAVNASECVSSLGLRDLVGNVREWTEECEGSSLASSCLARGGSMVDERATCQVEGLLLSRSTALPDLGFRCCAYPPP